MKRFTAFMLTAIMALSVSFIGCGTASINPNALGATLNGSEISLGFLNFYARYQQANYDSAFLSSFGVDMWSMEVEEGTTFEAFARQEILDSLETMILLDEHRGEFGIEITEEEMEAIDVAAERFMAENSSRAINQMGATADYVAELLRLFTVQHKMQQAIRAEADAQVTDEEAAQRTFSYIKLEKVGGDTGYELIGESVKQNFEAAAEENDLDISTHSYGADNLGGMDPAVIEAADALEVGQVSDVIDAEDAYYIIRLDSAFDREATDRQITVLIAQREQEHLNNVIDEYKENAEFTVNEKEWERVRFNRLFQIVTSE